MRKPKQSREAEPAACSDPACRWCVEGKRPDFCAALAAFTESPTREAWTDLRSKCIPFARRSLVSPCTGASIMGETVWQAACRSEGITNVRGGRFADGCEVPTRDDVAIALVVALASGEGR